jgi:hypothetical protein
MAIHHEIDIGKFMLKTVRSAVDYGGADLPGFEKGEKSTDERGGFLMGFRHEERVGKNVNREGMEVVKGRGGRDFGFLILNFNWRSLRTFSGSIL